MSSNEDQDSIEEIAARMLGKAKAYHDRNLVEVVGVYRDSKDNCIFDLPPPSEYYGLEAVTTLIGESLTAP